MRTIEIKIYEYEELSNTAKEAALNYFRENEPYHWAEDVIASINSVVKHFDFELTNWNFDWTNANRSSFTLKEGSFSDADYDLQGAELKQHLIDAQYLDYKCQFDQEWKKLLEENCPLTGVCFDDGLLDNIKEFIKNPESITMEELLTKAIKKALEDAQTDYEHQGTEEYLKEHFQANDYHFLENGELYLNP